MKNKGLTSEKLDQIHMKNEGLTLEKLDQLAGKFCDKVLEKMDAPDFNTEKVHEDIRVMHHLVKLKQEIVDIKSAQMELCEKGILYCGNCGAEIASAKDEALTLAAETVEEAD